MFFLVILCAGCKYFSWQKVAVNLPAQPLSTALCCGLPTVILGVSLRSTVDNINMFHGHQLRMAFVTAGVVKCCHDIKYCKTKYGLVCEVNTRVLLDLGCSPPWNLISDLCQTAGGNSAMSTKSRGYSLHTGRSDRSHFIDFETSSNKWSTNTCPAVSKRFCSLRATSEKIYEGPGNRI